MRQTSVFLNVLFIAGVASSFFFSACRDYTCEDTASCPVTLNANAPDAATSDGGVSSERPGATSESRTSDTASAAEASEGETAQTDPWTSSTSGTSVSDDGQGSMGGGTAALGASCEKNGDCAQGFCVDGVCCATACLEVCARCDMPGLAGTCAAADADEACGELGCPPDTECRSFVAAAGNNCVTLGQCQLDVECDAIVADDGAACQDGEGACENGQCVVPDKLVLGDPCGQADECGSGVCIPAVDGEKRCCELACDGLCEVCSVDGRCDAVPADDSDCPSVSCEADTSCTDYPDDLTSNRCAALGRCEDTATHCAPAQEPSGQSCGSGLACDGAGSCVSVCSGSQLWCGSCVNPLNDNSHCGDCGQACGAGLFCNNGSCQLSCATGEVVCNGRCVNPKTDMQYCGASASCTGGDACTSPEVCSNGECTVVCSGGTINCNDTCIDPNTNNTWCGASGNCLAANDGSTCANGYSCNSGVCRQQCPNGRVGCDGTCIDPSSDNNHCGASGFCEGAQAGDSCTGGEQCVSGSCRLPTGSPCSTNSQCASNSCLTFYRDADTDGFGALSSGTARFCTSPPSAEYVASNTDCCDAANDMALAKQMNPAYTGGFRDYGAVGCAEPFDWNCSRTLTKSVSVNRQCSTFTTSASCPGVLFGDDPACGVLSPATACGWTGTECVSARGAQWTQTCY